MKSAVETFPPASVILSSIESGFITSLVSFATSTSITTVLPVTGFALFACQLLTLNAEALPDISSNPAMIKVAKTAPIFFAETAPAAYAQRAIKNPLLSKQFETLISVLSYNVNHLKNNLFLLCCLLINALCTHFRFFLPMPGFHIRSLHKRL